MIQTQPRSPQHAFTVILALLMVGLLGEVLSRGRSDDVGALIAIAANLELLRMDLEDGTCKIEVPQTNSYGEVDW